LDIGVLGYIGIVWPKEHSPEVWSVPPVTPCVSRMHGQANIKFTFSSFNKNYFHFCIVRAIMYFTGYKKHSDKWPSQKKT